MRTARLALLLALAGGCAAPPPADSPPTSSAASPTPPPAPPADAGMWAGIDVGAKGVKPVAMKFVRTAGGAWDFSADTSLESRNTDLGTPAAGDRGFDPDRLKATVEAVKEMEEKLRKKYALPPERVKVVVSSGVFARLRDPAVAAAARKELEAALTTAVGRAPDFIDGRQEAELAARGTIAPGARVGRALVDVGSGNIKIGWYRGKEFVNRTVNTGTKALHDAAAAHARDKKVTFDAALAAVREPALADPLREVAKADGFAALTDVQVVGGAWWALATFTHPGTGGEPRVPLSEADVKRFGELVKLDKAALREQVLAGVTDPAVKAAAAKEVDAVQKVFTPDELKAAAEIARAVFAEGRLVDKKVVFFQKGQHAWIAGYLMEAAKLPD